MKHGGLNSRSVSANCFSGTIFECFLHFEFRVIRYSEQFRRWNFLDFQRFDLSHDTENERMKHGLQKSEVQICIGELLFQNDIFSISIPRLSGTQRI